MRAAAASTQHGVHEAGRARLARRPRQIHRIVHDRGRRHAIEVQQLIEAEAQDDERRQGRAGDSGRLAKCSIRWSRLRCQRSVPVTISAASARSRSSARCCAALRERGRQVGALAGDCAQRVERRRARRRGHATAVEAARPAGQPAPGARPARKSRAVIGRRPSGCSSLDRQAPPCPVGDVDRVARHGDDRSRAARLAAASSTRVFSRITRAPSRYV